MSTHARPIAAALALILSTAAVAGPLDKSRVPADAAWVVHLDMEAALRSSVAQACLDARGDSRLDRLDDLKEELGIDLLTDIKDATVFGVLGDGRDAVAVVTTSAAVDGVIEKLRATGQGYAGVTAEGYKLDEWTQDGQKQYSLVRKLGKDSRLVYLSKDKDRLIAAVGVGGGRGESLRGRTDSVLASDPGPGAILFVASDIIPLQHGGEVSMVLEKAKAVRFEFGQAGEDLYAALDLTMASAEDAGNVVQVLQGLKAMGRMFFQSNPGLAPVKDLLDVQTFEVTDATIGARMKYPAAKLVDALKAVGRQAEDAGDENTPKPGAKEHAIRHKEPL